MIKPIQITDKINTPFKALVNNGQLVDDAMSLNDVIKHKSKTTVLTISASIDRINNITVLDEIIKINPDNTIEISELSKPDNKNTMFMVKIDFGVTAIDDSWVFSDIRYIATDLDNFYLTENFMNVYNLEQICKQVVLQMELSFLHENITNQRTAKLIEPNNITLTTDIAKQIINLVKEKWKVT
jgi:hypothetical protein